GGRAGGTDMNLRLNGVVQLQHVHVTDRNWGLVRRPWTTTKEYGLAVFVKHGVPISVRLRRRQQTRNLFVGSTVEHWGCGQGIRWNIVKLLRQSLELLSVLCILGVNLPAVVCQPAQVQLQNLTNVHTTWNTVGVKQDVNRGTVCHKW